MEYCDLHAHSTYSYLDGYGRIHQIAEVLKNMGRKYMAITDHDTTAGFVDLMRYSKEFGLKPIYGAEMRAVSDIQEMRDTASREKDHITLLAYNSDGVRNLNQISSQAWEEGFYYLPTIDADMLVAHKSGLIILSGCATSRIQKLLNKDLFEEALEIARRMRKVFGDKFFLEIQPLDFEECKIGAAGIDLISKKLDIPMVVTNDVHFMLKGQENIWRFLSCVKRRLKWNDSHEMEPNCYYQTPEEVLENCNKNFRSMSPQRIGDAIEMSVKIAEMCNAELRIPDKLRFPFAGDKVDLLRSWCLEGFKKRNLLNDGVYKDRFDREIDLIIRKDFIDYFLIIADMIRFALENKIFVGFGRGSAAGSLCCYLLSITELDPIVHELLFERFIAEDRIDPPDIDIDFQKDRRDEIEQYIINKYGRDRVARLGSHMKYKLKNAMDDVARVFCISQKDIESVKTVSVTRGSGDARADLKIGDVIDRFSSAKKVADRYPLVQYVEALDLQYRSWGQHAAGIAMAQDSLKDIVGIQARSGERVTSCDYRRTDLINILKVDVLGLSTLKILDDILRMIKMEREELFKIPLDDKVTIKGFADKDVLGIFQFDGGASFGLVYQIDPPINCFGDLVSINALARPGTLHSGTTQLFMDARLKGEGHVWDHPIPSSITAETNGFIIYQEQVMKICKDLGLMEWEDIHSIRKTMAKSFGIEAFDVYKVKFVEGARKNGASDKLIEELWAHMCFFGSYGFNKSHSASYCLLSYYMMYMKMYHPLEFYCASIKEETGSDENKEKRKKFLKEAMGKGYTILPPKINASQVEMTIENDALRTGLKDVPGISEAAAKAIIEAYPIADLDDLKKRIPKRIANKRVTEAIEKWDMFNPLSDCDVFEIFSLDNILKTIKVSDKIGDLKYENKRRKITVAGKLLSRNLKSWKEYEETQIDGRTGGDKVKRWHTSDIDEWLYITIRDNTGIIGVHFKDETYMKYREQLWSAEIEDCILVVHGSVPLNRIYLIADRMEIVNPVTKAFGAQCKKCGLKDSVFVPPQKGKHNDIAFVAEAPGENEALKGIPLIGKAGKEVFDVMLEALGIKRSDIYVTNTCMCRPTMADPNHSKLKNRTPTTEEVQCCFDRLKNEISSNNPKLTVLMGKTAACAWGAMPEDAMMKDHIGKVIKLETGHNAVITYHPAGVLRNKEELLPVMIKNIKDAMLELDLYEDDSKSPNDCDI